MPSEIKTLSARRAYEFRPDDLRLTLLSLVPIVEAIQEALKFQAASVGTPAPTFGAVAQTLPPGIIFQVGSFVSEEVGIIPIRLLHFEPRRIVFDVAGPSSSIGPIFMYVQRLITELGLKASDGSPAIGPPSHVRDSSELSVHLAFHINAVLPNGTEAIFSDALGITAKPHIVVPTFTFQVEAEDAEYRGTDQVNQVNGPMVQLALRQGTIPSEGVYYSTAPLTSDAHIAYLTRLEEALSSRAHTDMPLAE